MVAKMPKSPVFRESRKAKRRVIDYAAWLLLDSSRQPVECIIRDMSETGARVATTAPMKVLPHRFTVWLDRNGKVQCECEIVWRKGGYVGVRFAARS